MATAAEQSLADADHPVERRNDPDRPRERDESERQQMQRVEHDSRERRIGERQREVWRLVGVGEVIQRMAGADSGGPTHVDVKVDEIRAVGHQIGPRQPRCDAQREQQWPDDGQPVARPRRGAGGGVYPPDSSDRRAVGRKSPNPLMSVTVE